MSSSSSNVPGGPWPRTRLHELLRLDHPIIQGPFGGGPSTVALASIVANAGGLGSYGAHHLAPADITATIEELHAATTRAFAINLWVSTSDLPEDELTDARFDASVARLQPLYDELGVQAPARPDRIAADFEAQVEAVLAARPPAFSFVFGVPDERILEACRDAGIVTLGTAITLEEAMALDAAGVDVIVASGLEAGGHRVAFLRSAEDSLVGTMSLIPQAVDAVRAPVVAAGGIADRRGVAAAFALGAEGVQVGTAFLATEESGTTDEHRALLREPGLRHTRLTRAFSGRLARGIPNRLMDELDAHPSRTEPFPLQGFLLAPLRAAAREQGRSDMHNLWAGQSNGLVHHERAADLFAELAGMEVD
jgi:nitronate monooxygenase